MLDILPSIMIFIIFCNVNNLIIHEWIPLNSVLFNYKNETWICIQNIVNQIYDRYKEIN